MSITPSRAFEIGDRRLHIYDDVFEPDTVQNFANVVQRLSFQRRRSFDKELSIPIDEDKFRQAPFLYPITEELFNGIAKDEFSVADSSVGLSHIYAAAMGPDACGTVHQDTDSPDALTFLYYANGFWKGRWSGETVFYDHNLDAVAAVTPKPGRLVLFHSNLFHRAGVPHPDTPTYRYTVSVFYYPEKAAPTADAEDSAGKNGEKP